MTRLLGASDSDIERVLRAALGAERVRVYPDDIKILGGTTNTQAAACREAKAPFIHLELSASLRNSITEDMTRYHTFYEIDGRTPGAIIETGFMLEDRHLLTERPDLVARGIVDGIVCFIEGEGP